MRRSEVVISIAAGLVLVLLVVVPSDVGTLIIRYVGAPAFNFWFVGALALAAAIILRMANLRPNLVRVLGLIGITWVVFVAGTIVALFVILATSGPFGP
jgi:hypothetical protein